jgi:hypothetical protein
MAPLRWVGPRKAVRGFVVGEIGLGLDDAAADAVDKEMAGQQIAGDGDRVALEEAGEARRRQAGRCRCTRYHVI